MIEHTINTKKQDPLWMIRPLKIIKFILGSMTWFLFGFSIFRYGGFPIYFGHYDYLEYFLMGIVSLIGFVIITIILKDLYNQHKISWWFFSW